MLSNEQKALLKRAQREASLSDKEYRECLETVAGVTSSTAPEFSDRHLDKALAFLEAIFWRKVDLKELPGPTNREAVFSSRDFWKTRNTSMETTRDRFALEQAQARVQAFEEGLAEFGCGPEYCAAIREKVTKGKDDVRALNAYAAALERTYRAKGERRLARAYEEAEGPFWVPDACVVPSRPDPIPAELDSLSLVQLKLHFCRKSIREALADAPNTGLEGVLPVFSALALLRKLYPTARYSECPTAKGNLFVAMVILRTPESFPASACAFAYALKPAAEGQQTFGPVGCDGSRQYLLPEARARLGKLTDPQLGEER
jgi:hypothetical protein